MLFFELCWFYLNLMKNWCILNGKYEVTFGLHRISFFRQEIKYDFKWFTILHVTSLLQKMGQVFIFSQMSLSSIWYLPLPDSYQICLTRISPQICYSSQFYLATAESQHLIVIGRDDGLSSLCHSFVFACL